LGCNWQQSENLLQLSTTATLLLNHLLKNYSNIVWQMPQLKSGLAPATLRWVLEWIEENLHLPLTIADLAAQAHLSEYHFAHMFRHSMQQTASIHFAAPFAKSASLDFTATYEPDRHCTGMRF
jgi:AraC family transcriptional regulator